MSLIKGTPLHIKNGAKLVVQLTRPYQSGEQLSQARYEATWDNEQKIWVDQFTGEELNIPMPRQGKEDPQASGDVHIYITQDPNSRDTRNVARLVYDAGTWGETAPGELSLTVNPRPIAWVATATLSELTADARVATQEARSAVSSLAAVQSAPNRYPLYAKLKDLGYSTSAPTPAQFADALKKAATEASQNNLILHVHTMSVEIGQTIDLPPGVQIEFQAGFKATRTALLPVFRCLGQNNGGGVGATTAAITTDVPGQNGPRMAGAANTNVQELRLTAGGVAALGVGVGDYLFVQSERTYSTGSSSGDGKYGNIRRVRSISGDNIQTAPLYRLFAVADQAKVRRARFVRGPRIMGGDFTDSAALRAGPTTWQPMFRFDWCEGADLSRVSVHDAMGSAVIFNHCLLSRADILDVRDLPEASGYGVVFQGACVQCEVSGGYYARLRHGFTTGFGHANDAVEGYGEPESCGVEGAEFYETYNTAIDTHEPGYGTYMNNNRIVNGAKNGIYNRSIGSIINNNTILSCTGTGITLAKEGAEVMVDGNIVRGTARFADGTGGYGIRVDSAFNVISNNQCARNDNVNIMCVSSSNVIDGNLMLNYTGLSLGSGSNNSISNNRAIYCSAAYVEPAGAVGNRWRNNDHTNTSGAAWSVQGSASIRVGNTGLPDSRPDLPAPAPAPAAPTALTSDPTATDYNALVDKLKAAGVLA